MVFRKLIVFVSFVFFLNTHAFSQYQGGAGSGFNQFSLENSFCSIETGNIFTGGNSEGSTFTMFTNTSCTISASNPYTGGSADGAAFSELIYTSCSIASINPFTGGNSDGFSASGLNNTACLISGINPFVGGNGEGFSNSEFINASCIVLGINPFFGGIADGHAFSVLSTVFCSVISINPFIGGIGDGHFSSPNATTVFWTGNDLVTPRDWHTASNWNINSVPDLLMNVTIPELGTGNYPIILAPAQTRCLNINNNGQLDIDPGGELSVSTAFHCNGILNINSPDNPEAAGSLIVEGSIFGSGTANIERYYSVSGRWQYTTVPFSNVTSDAFTLNASSFNPNFYYYNESFDLVPDPIGSIYSNWSLLSGAWTYAHGGPGLPLPLTKGSGYIYYDEGNVNLTFSNTVTDISNNDLVSPITFTQNDANSDYFDGWNLIGNPYPSAIDWDSFSKTEIQNTVYYWDGENQRYAYYNGVGGTETGDGSNVVNEGTRFIPSMQSFFVKAVTNGNLTIPRTSRVHSSQTLWKKSTHKNEDFVYLKLSATMNNTSDQTVIRFFDQASNMVDNEFDAYKVFTYTGQNLSSLAGDIPLAINSLPEFDTAMVIPILYASALTGFSTIHIDSKYLPENTKVYLEDFANHTITDITSNDYSFPYPQSNSFMQFNLFFRQTGTSSIDIAEPSEIKVFSFGKSIFVLHTDEYHSGTFQLYDLSGRMLMNDVLYSSKNEIKTNLANGAYLIKVVIGDKYKVQTVYLD